MHAIGLMQGRLSPQIDGKIQAFPWPYWEAEFPQAQQLGLPLIEWTLDRDRLNENPLLTVHGQRRIRELSRTHQVEVRSLTGDCFMQAPFHKANGHERASLLDDLRAVLEACAAIGIHYVIVPLVDDGRLDNAEQRENLLDGLLPLVRWLQSRNIAIVFESDFDPVALTELIALFPAQCFGINYDIGNSASLGYVPAEEIRAYGKRIVNVHVKDRLLGGTTVALGAGNSDFPTVFRELFRIGYCGDFVLQTARAKDGDHAGKLARYRDMVRQWVGEAKATGA